MQNTEPSYTDWKADSEKNKQLIISPNGAEGSARIQQDAQIYRVTQDDEATVHELSAGRGLWLQTVRGQLQVNGETLNAGDAWFTEQAGLANISGAGEALLFDLL